MVPAWNVPSDMERWEAEVVGSGVGGGGGKDRVMGGGGKGKGRDRGGEWEGGDGEEVIMVEGVEVEGGGVRVVDGGSDEVVDGQNGW